jgi:hypothetical protein
MRTTDQTDIADGNGLWSAAQVSTSTYPLRRNSHKGHEGHGNISNQESRGESSVVPLCSVIAAEFVFIRAHSWFVRTKQNSSSIISNSIMLLVLLLLLNQPPTTEPA